MCTYEMIYSLFNDVEAIIFICSLLFIQHIFYFAQMLYDQDQPPHKL